MSSRSIGSRGVHGLTAREVMPDLHGSDPEITAGSGFPLAGQPEPGPFGRGPPSFPPSPGTTDRIIPTANLLGRPGVQEVW